MRLHVVVEGQTEETFVRRVLAPHLGTFSVWADARSVMTARKHGAIYKGGLPSYALARKDILLWMKDDRNADAAFTTMFDLYGLPMDFPDYDKAKRQSDCRQRVATLEAAMKADIGPPRFTPYIQLHEFEALILADPQKLDCQFIEYDEAIRNLVAMAGSFESPELIDDGDETAPSKRIIREIAAYEGMKASAGPLIAERIGMATLRAKCQHFAEWLSNLEAVGLAPGSRVL
jgi:hypothetical protein